MFILYATGFRISNTAYGPIQRTLNLEISVPAVTVLVEMYTMSPTLKETSRRCMLALMVMRSRARRMEVRAASLLSNHCDCDDCGVVNVLLLTLGCNKNNGVLGCRL
jgi:hypothetical protein